MSRPSLLLCLLEPNPNSNRIFTVCKTSFVILYRRGDGAYLQAKGSCVIHECYVVDVHREVVILLATQKAKDEW